MKNSSISLFLTVMLLSFIGLFFIYSSSMSKALNHYGDSLFFVKKQALWICLGTLCLMISFKVPLSFYYRYTLFFMLALLLMLCLVLHPNYSVKINGARRWIHFVFFRFQPSELSKIMVIFVNAYFLNLYEKKKISFSILCLIFFSFMVSILFLIMSEKDLGTSFILIVLAWVLILFYFKKMYVSFCLPILCLPIFVLSILHNPFRVRRIVSYLDPWKDPKNTGYQIIQSLMAISRGGISGIGLGESVQKYDYLPEAQTDFIFSIYAEETGLIGVFFLLMFFSFFFFQCFRVVMRTTQIYCYLLAAGLSSLFFIEVCLNLFVVTGLLPTKGTTLPFLSFGGSSLIVHYIAVGFLMNIQRQQILSSSLKGKEE